MRMEIVCGFLGLVWAAIMMWLGHMVTPIWTPFLGAIVGVFLYVGYRSGTRRVHERDGVIKASLTIYIAQLIISYLLYGIGRGTASLLR
jgi:hypothetical protein